MRAEPLTRVLSMNDRLPDSVAITVTKGVTPWVRLALSADDAHRKLPAVKGLSIDTFDLAGSTNPTRHFRVGAQHRNRRRDGQSPIMPMP